VGRDGRVVAAAIPNADQDLAIRRGDGSGGAGARRNITLTEERLEQDVLRYNRIDPALDARVDDLLGRMTLAEKVGRLVQVTTPRQDILCEEFANDA
jgi:hypothetical protein